MSLYRQPGRVATRTLAATAVATLIAGGAIGFAVGRGTNSTPSLRSRVLALRADLAPARDGLELVQTEYGQAVHGGRVVAQTEYQAARSDVRRASDAIAAHRADLAILAPGATATLERRVRGLAQAVDGRADPTAVTQLASAAQQALTAVTGSSSA
jgi:hypothetical protein